MSDMSDTAMDVKNAPGVPTDDIKEVQRLVKELGYADVPQTGHADDATVIGAMKASEALGLRTTIVSWNTLLVLLRKEEALRGYRAMAYGLGACLGAAATYYAYLKLSGRSAY